MLHGGEIYEEKYKTDHDFSVNLNPLGCPGEVKRALEKSLDNTGLYPDYEQRAFREAVSKGISAAASYKIKGDDKNVFGPECIIGGSGASELINAILISQKPGKVLMPVPCFSGYMHAIEGMAGARSLGHLTCEVDCYPLKEENSFALTEEFCDHITKDIDMVIVANPNNPTGRLIAPDIMKSIAAKCKETKTTLVVDECFLLLSTGGRSAAEYIKSGDVYIINAFTKLFSIPGVRAGFCISSKENTEKIKKALPEWNLSCFAGSAGIAGSALLADPSYLQKVEKEVEKERTYLEENLKRLGITCYKSDSCFILIRYRENLCELLKKRGILIRDCGNFTGLEKGGFMRIAVKNRCENDILIRELGVIQARCSIHS